ncbi:MAG TPA: hypothetical protein VFB42_03520 [Gaiellaceae bacterium]|nr:hypothetical protein [Gaiellaceae bacterium]
MIRKLARRGRDEQGERAEPSAPLFNLDELHERRILSWSPEADADEPEERPEPEPEPEPEPPRARTAHSVPRARPARVAAEPAVRAPRAAAGVATAAAEEDEPEERHPAGRRRGRPRGRPRRQVHFHVDPDEEALLLAAVEKYGSQQKGLIAALQALHDIEVVRDEVERLAAECERQRRLLDEMNSLFNR